MKRLSTRNNKAVLIKDIPLLTEKEFIDEVLSNCRLGCRAGNLFVTDYHGNFRINAILSDDENSSIYLTSAILDSRTNYPSLTQHYPFFHIFEREIFENTGITPTDHPWLKPVRYPENRYNKNNTISNYPFYRMSGEDFHEVGVGPVHAGVIEPGHFRFSCAGEVIEHLEIQLGYQHRGIEPMLENSGIEKKSSLVESISGDTVIGHTCCYAAAVESLSQTKISTRADAIRGIALELERIAIHLGDLSALCGDIAYLSGYSIFAAMRTTVINTTQNICGNRFGKNLIVPGGVLFDISKEQSAKIIHNLSEIDITTEYTCNELFSDPGVLSRMETTGFIDKQTAVSMGFVGPAARASGVSHDVRSDHPYGIYRYFPVYPRLMESGDVFARAYIRYLEIQQSISLVCEILENMPEGSNSIQNIQQLNPESLCVSLTEGWRGEIAHCILTDMNGHVKNYKIKDPSMHNWSALAQSVRNNGISDFPLCNKSFNLSYCGFDL